MYRAGIDLGGTTIKAGIIDENQKILAQMSAPTKAECPAGVAVWRHMCLRQR